jgi:hypothetical protein
MVVLYDNGNDEIELPEDFEPSCHDAIVGWARQNYHHCEYGGTFAKDLSFFLGSHIKFAFLTSLATLLLA